MFSRFCRFYGFTDTHVLNMPSTRFWAMEKQIDRIRASEDLRDVTIGQATQSKDAAESIVKRLTLEIGTPFKMRPNIFVKPESDAKAKFESLL